MNKLELYEQPVCRIRDFMNQQYFYDRVYHSIVEDGNNLNYGDFVSRILTNGFIKVAKSLNIYLVTGRGKNKKVHMHPKLIFIINSSAESNKIISKTIIDLVNGKYSKLILFKIESFESFLSLKSEYKSPIDPKKCTYLIFNPLNNLTKIGKSSNVDKRLNALKNQFNNKLILIGFLNTDIETKLHLFFSEKRNFGEWFSLSIDDVLDAKNIHNIEIYNINNIG